MYRQLDDFFGVYEDHIGATGKILSAMTDANLGTAITDGHRTLGQIAWHIVTTVPEMMKRAGLGLSTIAHEQPPPSTAQEIQAGYKMVTEELIAAIRKNWNDETLKVTDDMYGEQWPRGQTLAILIRHEVHHRGQMTILLRQAGAKVPGIFGPSKEEWSQYGMESPPY